MLNCIDKNETYKYIANYLIEDISKTGDNIFTFTSSNGKSGFLNRVIENLSHVLEEKKLKVLVVQTELKDNRDSLIGERSEDNNISVVKMVNATKKRFNDEVLENKDSFDIILISIPCIAFKADALEYAKIFKNLILVEKYTQCYYSTYENILNILKVNNIEAKGVITVK